MMKKQNEFHLMSNSLTNLSVVGGSIKNAPTSASDLGNANSGKQIPGIRRSSGVSQHWVFFDDEGSGSSQLQRYGAHHQSRKQQNQSSTLSKSLILKKMSSKSLNGDKSPTFGSKKEHRLDSLSFDKSVTDEVIYQTVVENADEEDMGESELITKIH
jgi:hypothetical protein